ncbi:catalase [Macrococcoides caseolyticum]|uniref:catalase n=1 Tax=Macrococcoides caseolyticum TaxID=69966 RepID=UPI000C32EA7D|nr:catalase [Macrococcus caseolyticus]PKE62786.1 catalase HPII [Macrococcus caseolyticus]
MTNKKDEQLEAFRRDHSEDTALTTNQGLKMAEDEFSLKAGGRGPTLLEDFHFREKMTHFDHERIPERIVHARGYGAHGEFELYEDLSEYTKAKFLTNTSKKTPVFVRFSTVQGSKGSNDTVRDARGFATKFYTEEGNYDLVGNNIPVFFIQDAIKFPDLVHAIKPEPHNEIPQGGTAHDTFWDFFAQNPESTHMTMWTMSDRGLPKSFRTMEGFGVHTFRLINKEGKSHFVKFHWKPLLGTHSLVWDEAQIIAGKNSDYNREDLYEAIDKGDYPEWELGLQILPEEDEFKFDFDILDPTKLWPEEEVPVKRVGKMTLNRNVDNVFAETEQVAFHPGHLVPGIDFSNDPLLQGRLFSYTDTQLSRLGGPNFHQIPINRPVCPFANNQRDGMHQSFVHKGQTSYHNNAINNNNPHTTPVEEGGFESYHEKIDAHKVRARSDSFKEHYAQAKLYYNSLTQPEKEHLRDGFAFELGKCKHDFVKENAIANINKVDKDLATQIADKIGVQAPATDEEVKSDKKSPALSMENTIKKLDTLSVAIMVTASSNESEIKALVQNLSDNNVNFKLVAEKAMTIGAFKVSETFDTVHSTFFDGIIVLDAKEPLLPKAKDYVEAANRHFKTIGFNKRSEAAIDVTSVQKDEPGIVEIDGSANNYLDELVKQRHWDRQL